MNKEYVKTALFLSFAFLITSCIPTKTDLPLPVNNSVVNIDKSLLTGWWAPGSQNVIKDQLYFGADNFFYKDTLGHDAPVAGSWKPGAKDTIYYVGSTVNAVNTGFIVTKLTQDSLIFHVIGSSSVQKFRKATLPAFTSTSITTIAGTGIFGYTGDGDLATSAQLSGGGGIVIDKQGNIIFADRLNRVIRKISVADGKITTTAGLYGSTVSVGNGKFAQDHFTPLTFPLADPVGLAMDAAGNIYFSESDFDSRIMKISATDGKIYLIAGDNGNGFSGDGGPALNCKLSGSQGLAVDADGNLYIADIANSRIRKITAADGKINTIAGTGNYKYSGDGGLAAAAAISVFDLALDNAGNIYFTDFGNNRIRKIAANTGIITTIAGTGDKGYSGDGGSAIKAQLNSPYGIKVASNGDIYFNDTGSNCVRKIAQSTGIITTIAGNGYSGYIGVGIHATAYSFSSLYGIAVDANNNVYVSDGRLGSIRKISAQ